MTTYEWITTFLVPVTGIVSWLAGARMRRNESIKALMTTIDMLNERNKELYEEIAELRKENADLKSRVNSGNLEIEKLKLQIEKLSNPKPITP